MYLFKDDAILFRINQRWQTIINKKKRIKSDENLTKYLNWKHACTITRHETFLKSREQGDFRLILKGVVFPSLPSFPFFFRSGIKTCLPFSMQPVICIYDKIKVWASIFHFPGRLNTFKKGNWCWNDLEIIKMWNVKPVKRCNYRLWC